MHPLDGVQMQIQLKNQKAPLPEYRAGKEMEKKRKFKKTHPYETSPA